MDRQESTSRLTCARPELEDRPRLDRSCGRGGLFLEGPIIGHLGTHEAEVCLRVPVKLIAH